MGEMVIMNGLEWSMLLYYVIYYEKFKQVMERIEKEALIGVPKYTWLKVICGIGRLSYP